MSQGQTTVPRLDQIQAWVRSKLEDVLDEVQSVVRDDGIYLADMAINFSGGKSVFESVFVGFNNGRG